MNAVVLTVKASYIASTKYRSKSGNKEVKLILIFLCRISFCFSIQADCSMENAFTRKETIDFN
jgi:hypothetical protein